MISRLGVKFRRGLNPKSRIRHVDAHTGQRQHAKCIGLAHPLVVMQSPLLTLTGLAMKILNNSIIPRELSPFLLYPLGLFRLL